MENSAVISSNKKDDLIIFTLLFSFTIIACKNMFVSTLVVANNFNYELNIIINSVVLFIYIRCFYKIRFKFSAEGLKIVFLVFLFIMSSFFFHNDLFQNKIISNSLISFIMYSIPYVLLIPLVSNTNKLLNKAYYFSFIMGLVAIIVFVFAYILKFTLIRGYSMSYSSNSLFATMFLYSKYFHERKMRDLVLASTVFACIVLLGSRQVILCVGLFVIFKLIGFMDLRKIRGIITLFVLLLMVFWLFVNSDNLLYKVDNFLSKHGVSSRTFNMFMEGRIDSDSGRSDIHKTLLNEIKKSPFIGYGIYGGAYILKETTPHHFILDTWADFGVFVGTFLIMFFAFLNIKNYRLFKGTSYSELIIVLTFMIWPLITIGMSWRKERVWLLIALFLLAKKQKNLKSINMITNNKGINYEI